MARPGTGSGRGAPRALRPGDLPEHLADDVDVGGEAGAAPPSWRIMFSGQCQRAVSETNSSASGQVLSPCPLLQ